MQDKNAKTTTPDPIAAANAMAGKAVQGDFVQKIVEKIKNSENILIALSKDPTVDDIAAAIGLTVYLDGMQKHATAIYSGRTPENLKFLQPDATFERNTDSLQDFIISLSKDKADHLRYKLEGDFVKIFITPYKTKLSEEDLNFSYGDYNVDFVIAINVPSAGNLDEALREHGRIMHDAAVVNITTGEPGRFGEIEWSNPTASSLCEMITELIFAIQGNDETPLDKDVATALLTGIVAATDRFSNERTNPDTMGVASKLMSMGADQKLITTNVNGNEVIHNDGSVAMEANKKPAPKDRTNLAVEHNDVPAGPLADAMNKANGVAMGVSAGVATGVSDGSAIPAASANPAVAPAGGANGNPAVQAAPNANFVNSPNPPTVVTATNNVAPESVVVQPVIPGANGGSAASVPAGVAGVPTTVATAPAPADPSVMSLPNVVAPSPAVNAPASNVGQMQVPGAPVAVGNSMPAPGNSIPAPAVATNTAATADPNASRPMATSAPAEPTTRQVGSTIQPPAPKPKKQKNYAEMLEEALAEPIGNNAVNNMQPAGAPSASAPADPSMLNLPVAPPVSSAAPAPVVAGVGTPAPMEPVANPMGGAVLPPPPAPTTGSDMMPPVLPPVQVPTEGQ